MGREEFNLIGRKRETKCCFVTMSHGSFINFAFKKHIMFF